MNQLYTYRWLRQKVNKMHAFKPPFFQYNARRSKAALLLEHTKRVMYSHTSRSKISFVGTGTLEEGALCVV